MSQIPAGSIVQAQVGDGQTVAAYSGGLNANDIVNAVSAYLASRGLPVRSSSVAGNITSTIFPWIQETFQAALQIQPANDTDTDSIIAEIQSGFQEVTGQTPSNVTIPSFSAPDGSTVNTGQPNANQGILASTGTAITDTIKSFFDKLGTASKTLLIAVFALIVLLLVLAAYGPNVGAIARAV